VPIDTSRRRNILENIDRLHVKVIVLAIQSYKSITASSGLDEKALLIYTNQFLYQLAMGL
jgi:hypothetical protein